MPWFARRFSVAYCLLSVIAATLVGCQSDGLHVSEWPHVLTDGNGSYEPEPGFIWVSHAAGDYRVRWAGEGYRHPAHAYVASTSEEGVWEPMAGFSWLNPENSSDLRVVWCGPDVPHPDYPHVVSMSAPNTWEPAPGYQWASPLDTDDYRVVPR